ncbi:MAG TPA: bifunctional oligoribonuclease/PAP phosphatase NrnA [Chitinophagales bacterium]|nr:bifunctional oligoribonuclease/PAP phosphatase NrnA [Chitinophagales bacterium]
MKFAEEKVAQLKEILSSPKKMVIVTHRNPDGDALGSSLAWKFFLEKLGHEATFVSPNPFTQNLKWIHGTDELLIHESEMGRKLCEAKIKSADYIFCLDFNALSRLEGLGEVLKKATAPKIVIDHHQQPEHFALLLFSDVTYCATSEMLCDLIADLGYQDLMDQRMAENLFTGLCTDNGFFQFNNTTANALSVASVLVGKGARPDYVSDRVNNVFRETRLRFFGYCLHEKLKLVKNGTVAYILVTQAEIKKFNLQAGDSESLVNYPFKIEGVQVCAYFSEEPDKVKISFRSRGEVDVNTFARTYFEGGGHRNAAGGRSSLNLEKTEKKFLDALENLKLA